MRLAEPHPSKCFFRTAKYPGLLTMAGLQVRERIQSLCERKVRTLRVAWGLTFECHSVEGQGQGHRSVWDEFIVAMDRVSFLR